MNERRKLLAALAKDIYGFEVMYRIEEPVLGDAIQLTADEEEPTVLGLLCEEYMKVVEEKAYDATFVYMMLKNFPEGAAADDDQAHH
jgi:cytoplasmic iron level regulating protein YaaA (DUF328/UPF0246 family)